MPEVSGSRVPSKSLVSSNRLVLSLRGEPREDVDFKKIPERISFLFTREETRLNFCNEFRP